MGIGDLLFPVSCLGCGELAGALCPSCVGQLEPPEPFPVPEGLDTCTALTSYAGVARRVVSGLKYRNDRSALAALAASAARAVPVDRHLHVVTWVPTVPSHRRGRGFDHGELLARAVGRSGQRPARALLTRAEGQGQTGRGRDARRRPTPFLVRRRVAGSVLLVDDVLTTGATLSAAAEALRAAGAGAVHGLALAHTPPSVRRDARS